MATTGRSEEIGDLDKKLFRALKPASQRVPGVAPHATQDLQEAFVVSHDTQEVGAPQHATREVCSHVPKMESSCQRFPRPSVARFSCGNNCYTGFETVVQGTSRELHPKRSSRTKPPNAVLSHR